MSFRHILWQDTNTCLTFMADHSNAAVICIRFIVYKLKQTNWTAVFVPFFLLKRCDDITRVYNCRPVAYKVYYDRK